MYELNVSKPRRITNEDRDTYFDRTTAQSAIDLALTFPIRLAVGFVTWRAEKVSQQQLSKRSRIDVAAPNLFLALDNHMVCMHFPGKRAFSRTQRDHPYRLPWSLE
jgi:hypothetical protein